MDIISYKDRDLIPASALPLIDEIVKDAKKGKPIYNFMICKDGTTISFDELIQSRLEARGWQPKKLKKNSPFG